MRYLILLLLFCSCQDEPIVPNEPAPIIKTYQAQIRAHCDQTLIFYNGVQYGNGQSVTTLERDVKTGDEIRLYGHQFNNIANYTSYIKLDGEFYFMLSNWSAFDTTIIIP
jgi:hypothetical protein